jgi:hypothetical protein
MIKNVVSSNIDDLEVLSKIYPWIPDHDSVRPTPEVLTEKLATLSEINDKWQSLEDYILFKVFSKEFSVEDGKYFVRDKNVTPSTKIFEENHFPYNTPEGQHWVLWYGSKQQPYDNDTITADVNTELRSLLGRGVSFDFAWYANPKMSVPDFFHVQVFWTRLM